MSVFEVDPRSIATTIKKAGKTLAQNTWTVSDDGNTLTVKTTMYSESGEFGSYLHTGGKGACGRSVSLN